jgi:MoxR-like ATPase
MASKLTNEEVVDRVVEIVKKNKGMLHCKWDSPKIEGLEKNIKNARVRMKLSKRGYATDLDVDDKTFTIYSIGESKEGAEPKASKTSPVVKKPRRKRTTHSFLPPSFDKDVRSILTDEKPHNVWFWGSTGCGKTVYTEWLGKQLKRKVFRINCRRDMDSSSFFGEKTIEIDEVTKQNFIKHVKGILELAMIEGLDDNGEEIEGAEPGILYIDEAAAIPSYIAIGLNRILECDSAVREICLDTDGGRVVKSHKGFRIILSANTMGRGMTDMSMAGYTAQGDALDISILNRMTAYFRFGYNKQAEKNILKEKVGNDKVAKDILRFRDGIREAIKTGECTTPFSTRSIINIADMYRIYEDLGKALNYTVFNSVLPEEKSKYNELGNLILGFDIDQKYNSQKEFDM